MTASARVGRRVEAAAKLLAALTMAATVAACSTEVLHGVNERAANEATAALERAGVGAEKAAAEGATAAGGSYSVRVARADSRRALELLAALGLPRERRRGFAEAYGQPSLIPTPLEERARFLDALVGEIERTLESVDGVVTARVHLVLEETDPLATDPTIPRTGARAAVLLKVRPGRAPVTESDVQKLVAGSVAGLQAAAVAVVTSPAPEPTGGTGAQLSALGPLRVSAGTRPVLLIGLAAVLGLLAAMAALLMHTARRLSMLERRAEEATDSDA